MTRPATIVQRWSAEVKRKKSVDHEFYVRYRVEGRPELVQDRVGEEKYVVLVEGAVVPARVSPLETTIGPHPTLNGILVLPGMLGLLVVAVVALRNGFRRRAWYETSLDCQVGGRLEG